MIYFKDAIITENDLFKTSVDIFALLKAYELSDVFRGDKSVFRFSFFSLKSNFRAGHSSISLFPFRPDLQF